MSIRYRKVQNKIKSSTNYGKWYGHSVIIDTVDTKTLATEISHSTTVTYADVVAVLIETAEAMRRHLLNSHKVTLDGIGSFRVGVRSTGTSEAKDFGSGNIYKYHVIYSPASRFVATGVNEKGRRTGHFVADLIGGATAREASAVKGAAPTPGAETEPKE